MVRTAKPFVSWLKLWAITVMLGLIPVLTSFWHNRTEVALQALALPAILAILTGLIVALIYTRILKHNPLAAYVAAILAAVLFNNGYDSRLNGIYPLFQALVPLPQLGAWGESFFSLLFFLTVILLGRLAGQMVAALASKRKWPAAEIMGAVLVAVTITFLFILLPCVKFAAGAWSQYFYKPPALAALPANAKTADKPDIYYIDLEDYASPAVLKSQFGFEDTPFLQFLQQKGYFVNSNLHNNYPYTTMSVASTLSAGYVTDLINKFAASGEQTLNAYHRTVQYAPIAQLLKSIGYSYSEIGTWYETNNRAPLADHFYMQDSRLEFFNRTKYLDNFTKNSLSQSIYWRLIEHGLHLGSYNLLAYQGQGQVDMTHYALDSLGSIANSQTGGRLIYAQLIVPHEPYHFNADGSIAQDDSVDNHGRPIKQKYLDQIKYIDGQMMQLLSSIETHSHGRAVVLLQSDEGPYPIELNHNVFNRESESDEINNSDMTHWSSTDLAMKYGAFGAYHIPAASPSDLAIGADSINSFRVILNRYFGTALPYLTQCYYALPNGRKHAFVYDDITKILTGQSNTVCATNGTGPK